MKGITSTRKLGKEEIESIELTIRVARMKKEKIKNLWTGFGEVTEVKKDVFLFTDSEWDWNPEHKKQTEEVTKTIKKYDPKTLQTLKSVLQGLSY